MSTNPSILAISPLDGRYYSKCRDLSEIVSEHGLNYYRTLVEIKWLLTLSENEELPEIAVLAPDEQALLNTIIEQFDVAATQKIKDFEATTNHDVKAVEYYIKDFIQSQPSLLHLKEFVHFACTSEDINNLAYGLMLKDLRDKILLPLGTELLSRFESFAQDYADIPMLSRTHGQAASPTTVGKEFANVNARLLRQLQQLQKVEILGKINGAVGNFNAHLIAYPNVAWDKIAQHFIENLELSYNAHTTQIEPHDYIAEYFHCLIRINTILIDFCRDIWGYIALGYFKQKPIANEVGSSTMPHKVNPIDFENAEGNLGLANALLSHMAEKLPISRWQRDLSDSTVLRNIGVASGYQVIAFQAILKGFTKLSVDSERMLQDLNQNWEVLGEAIQTVMRKYGIENPYEKLKALTRGKTLTQAACQQFIDGLTLPEAAKAQLKALTPATYLGMAASLAKG